MKKKRILFVLAGLVLVLLAVIVVAAFSLGAIVKKGVETIGPRATQVNVQLASAQVWLFGGRVQLEGFVLGNPPGCATPSAVEVKDISVSVQPGSLMSDKVVVEKVTVKAPVITWEGGLTDSNLKKIERNLNDYTGSGSPSSKSSSTNAAKPGKKLQVNDLVITDAKLQVHSLLSAGKTVSLSIPDIHLSNLGTGPDGITAVEVGEQALHAVLTASTAAIAKNAGNVEKAAVSGVKKGADALKSLIH